MVGRTSSITSKKPMTKERLYYIGICARMICGAVLLFAAVSKLINFGTYLHDFPLGAYLPREFVTILACGVIALEVGIGIELVSLEGRAETAKVACVIFSIFLLVSLLRIFPTINNAVFPKGCNCFPGTEAFFDFSNEVLWHIMRNLAFAVFAYANLFAILRLKNTHDEEDIPGILGTAKERVHRL